MNLKSIQKYNTNSDFFISAHLKKAKLKNKYNYQKWMKLLVISFDFFAKGSKSSLNT